MHFSTNAHTASSPWGTGSIIAGRYRLLDRLGMGGMGEVWRAEHLSLGTMMALKLVNIETRPNPAEILARFQQEARAAARLKSPYVVQILDHGVDGAVAFMVMELLEGESLEQRLERRKVLSADEVGKLLWEVCRGVDRAHAEGVIHRDLKPSNVFMAKQSDGTEIAKVVDFGIAKVLGTPPDVHLQTQTGLVIGTPSYMSPEQVLGRSLDHRSDLWSLTVIACEALTGRRLFAGETLGQVFMLICTTPIVKPSSRATVPSGFDAWFEKGTARPPGERFQSARELAEELCHALGITDMPITGTSAALRPSSVSTPETWSHAPPLLPRSRKLFTSLVISGAALAGVGLAYGLLAQAERPANQTSAPARAGSIASATVTALESPTAPPPAAAAAARTPEVAPGAPHSIAPPAAAPPNAAPPNAAAAIGAPTTALGAAGSSAAHSRASAPNASGRPQAPPGGTVEAHPAPAPARPSDPDFGF